METQAQFSVRLPLIGLLTGKNAGRPEKARHPQVVGTNRLDNDPMHDSPDVLNE